MGVLRLDGIGKQFGDKTVLQRIDLEIGAETFCVLLGPSGCGKSTLLNIVAGLEPPSTGRITFDGVDITGLPPHKRNVAMVFQNYALYPHLTVYENIAFGLRIRRLPKDEIEEKVRTVSASLGIDDKLDRYPRQLSGGERQRVATGRAIVRDPNVFLFDEPLSNLDARLRLEMRKEFLQLHQRLRRTALYVTHDQIEALALGDLITVLKDGRIQQVSPPHTLYNDPVNRFVASFIGSPPMNLLDLDVEGRGEGLHLRRGAFALQPPQRLARAIEAGAHRQVTLGIRPPAVLRNPPAGDDACVIDGTVLLEELLGDDVLVYVQAAGEVEIRAVFMQDDWDPGCKAIRIAFPYARLYAFDAAGRRLRY